MIYTLGLTDRQAGAVFAYLFSLIPTKQYKEEVPNGYRLKQDVIDNSGYILKNCKVFAYRYAYRRYTGGALPNYERYGIHEADVDLLKRLNLDNIDMGRYKAASLKRFDKVVSDVLSCKEFEVYLSRFIHKKLRFIIQSYGDSFDNIKSHLKEKALYHIYRTYPYFDTKLHMLNVAKRAAHNAGIDYIRHKTSQKNNRLVFDGEGYMALNVDIDSLHHLPTEDPGRINAPCLTNFKFSKRAALYLSLMQGEFDSEFSEYLGTRNDVYVHEVTFRRYRAKVEEYLGLSPQAVESLFEKIRQEKF